MSKFPDFDTLKQLAEDNPASLQALLDRETASIMSKCPARLRPRLEGLQFQIEGQRRLAKNPMDSLLRIYGMMNQSFEELNDALAPFRDYQENDPQGFSGFNKQSSKKSAKSSVLHFPLPSATGGSSQYKGA